MSSWPPRRRTPTRSAPRWSSRPATAPSQRWNHLFASGGKQSTFQNELTGLILTNSAADGVVLEGSNSKLPSRERGQHIQTFGQTNADVD
jgi:hypothetical protein